MTIIDVHSHVIPPGLVNKMREGTAPDDIRIENRQGQPWVVHRQGYQYPLLDSFHNVEARISAMDAENVDVAVLSVAPPLFLYWIEKNKAREAARTINDAIAQMVAMAPNRFSGMATLPMQDPAEAVIELHRAIDELGLKGAQVGPHIEGVPLDDVSLRPVLRAAVELDVPLMIHPYYVGSSPGLDDYYLTNLQGNPWQTAVCASRMILSGTLDELPELKLVLVHGGGHLPYQIGRLDHGYRVRPEAKVPAQAPSSYLRRFHYDTLTHRSDATNWLIDQVGADRVLFGTDMPFDMGGPALHEQLGNFTGTDEDLRAIGSGNAEILFSLNRKQIDD